MKTLPLVCLALLLRASAGATDRRPDQPDRVGLNPSLLSGYGDVRTAQPPEPGHGVVPGPASTLPQRPAGENGTQDDAKCEPAAGLKVVRLTAAAALLRNDGLGTPESPRKYCLVWLGEGTNENEPLLVFTIPSDGKHGIYPEGGVTLTNKRFSSPDDPRGRGPFQVWAIPDVKPGLPWGLYAVAENIDHAKSRAGKLKPLMWWGSVKHEDFDAVPETEMSAKLEQLGLSGK